MTQNSSQLMKISYILLLILTFPHATFSQENTFTVYFDFGKHTLNSAEEQRLMSFKKALNPTNQYLSISGYTDTVSSEGFNKNLAKRRIETVLNYLQTNDSPSKIINGEKDGNLASNYKDAEFRKVIITYSINNKSINSNESAVPTKEIQQNIIEEPTIKADAAEEKSMEKSVEIFLKEENSEVLNFDLSILFYNNSDIPLPESEPEFKTLYRIMRENNNLDIMIHGHVCCSDNYEISFARAKTVYNYLLEGGIDFRRMKYIGHSNSQPKISPEITEEDMKQNRRVTIEFIKK